MQQRLSHKMEIEKLYLTLQTVGKRLKLSERKTPLCSIGLRTEETVEIADICYFKVTTCYHSAKILTNEQEIADFRSFLRESANPFINLCSKFDNSINET